MNVLTFPYHFGPTRGLSERGKACLTLRASSFRMLLTRSHTVIIRGLAERGKACLTKGQTHFERFAVKKLEHRRRLKLTLTN